MIRHDYTWRLAYLPGGGVQAAATAGDGDITVTRAVS